MSERDQYPAVPNTVPELPDQHAIVDCLTIILGTAQLVRRRPLSARSPQLETRMERIEEAAWRLARTLGLTSRPPGAGV